MFLQCQMPQMMLALTATEGLTPVSSYSHIPIGLLRIHKVDHTMTTTIGPQIWTLPFLISYYQNIHSKSHVQVYGMLGQ